MAQCLVDMEYCLVLLQEKKSDSCVAPPLTVDGSPTNDKSQRRRKITRAIFAARTTNELHLQLFIVEKPFFVYKKASSSG